ncbi:MAG: hypothetical protein ACSHX6_05455 [Akkermansiaceae bacterium]
MKIITFILFFFLLNSVIIASETIPLVEITKLIKDKKIVVCSLNGSGKKDEVLVQIGYNVELTHIDTNVKNTGYYIVIRKKSSRRLVSRVSDNLEEKVDLSHLLGRKFKSVSMGSIIKIFKRQEKGMSCK